MNNYSHILIPIRTIISRGKSILSLYRYQLKDMVSKRKPELEDPEKYEQFLQEVAEECIEYKSSMLLFNMYAQKPHN